MIRKNQFIALILCGLTLFSSACSLLTTIPEKESQQALYSLAESGKTALSQYAPAFLVEGNQENYNRIGTPVVKIDESGEKKFLIDTERSSVYAMTQEFNTANGSYTNLIYRIHFPETPMPNLTAGRNVGLLVYVTLNSEDEPVLISTLHTCGCYLAFIPTAKLPESARPKKWQKTEQIVYGEILPALIERENEDQRLVIKLRRETHRVMDVGFLDPSEYKSTVTVPMQLRPMAALNRLPVPGREETVSFFETKGHRKGLVRGSRKPLEMLFMSWWAVDPFIGVDKALGPPEETGTVMYTSLKFWDREESNIWNFPRFLKYWGWNL